MYLPNPEIRYAIVREAEFYALAKEGTIFLDLVKIFIEKGREGLMDYKGKENYEFGKIPEEPDLFNNLVKRSETFRKKVRGELIGALG